MLAVVTFDLHEAAPGDYERAYELLSRIGLQPVTPVKQLDLPFSTAMGTIVNEVEVDASTLRDFVWDAFKKEGLQPSRILGGVLSDWAARSR